jgi:hypothetical protein
MHGWWSWWLKRADELSLPLPTAALDSSSLSQLSDASYISSRLMDQRWLDPKAPLESPKRKRRVGLLRRILLGED